MYHQEIRLFKLVLTLQGALAQHLTQISGLEAEKNFQPKEKLNLEISYPIF